MIDVQAIEFLTTNIDTLQGQVTYHSSVIVAVILLSMVAIVAIISFAFIYNKSILILLFVIIIPIIIGINSHTIWNDAILERNNLIELRTQLYEKSVIASTCEELRLHNLDVLQNEYSWYLEDKSNWAQDLYYTKCEIPLREEVMKLK